MHCALCVVILSGAGLWQESTIIEKGCGPKTVMFLSLSDVCFGDILH